MSEEMNGISRRTVLKGAAVGGLGLAAGSTLLTSCSKKASGPLSFGARTVDESPTKQLKGLVAAYEKKTGNKVTYNATESNAFQNNLSQYLQGTPDDAFQWMAGYRMQFFAQQGLLVDLSDVWKEIGDQYAESYKIASTGLDGKQYFVPQSWYPWGIHFRKSMLADLGMTKDDVRTWDGYMKMLAGMQKKGLIGYALGDKGGWEAMGTFDSINSRVNGYQFHVDLLAGREKWTDSRVTDTMNRFAEMLPYTNKNILDLEWDGAMQLLLQKKAGSFHCGSWFGANFKEVSDADYADLTIAPFPEINPEHGVDTIDAPIDGFCAAANGANPDGGADFVKFAGDKEGMQAMLDTGIPMTSANKNQDTSSYDAFQKEQLEVMGEAKYITQFLDRDTRPDFAGPVFGPALQAWLRNPKETAKFQDSLQKQWDALPALS